MANLSVEAGSESVPPEKRLKMAAEIPVCEFKEEDSSDESEYECVPYDDGSSDDDFPLEAFQNYSRQIEESEGFDVDDFGQYDWYNPIFPVDMDDFHQTLLTPLAKEALNMFNQEKKKNFKFVRLVNITERAISCIQYNITFEGEDAAEGETGILFQATVLTWPIMDRKPDIRFCRIKPTKKPGEPGREEPTIAELCRLRPLKLDIY